MQFHVADTKLHKPFYSDMGIQLERTSSFYETLQHRRKKEKLPPQLKKLSKDLAKMAEIQRLERLMRL